MPYGWVTLLVNPNLSTGYLYVDVEKESQLFLRDQYGKKILEIKGEIGGETSIDMRDLEKGLYILQINNAGNTTIKKIVRN